MGKIYVSAAVCTDYGSTRTNNDDNYFLVNRGLPDSVYTGRYTDSIQRLSRGVLAVFGGLGVDKLGQEGASVAASVLKRHSYDILVGGASAVDSYVEDVNDRLCELTRQNSQRVGSTMAMAAISREAVTLYNIGNCRSYLYSSGKLRQLTVDDTVVNRLVASGAVRKSEARYDSRRLELTAHLGVFSNELELKAHSSTEILLSDGDRVLLCTDGVTEALGDETLILLLSSNGTCEELASKVVDTAIMRGGLDNMTALVAEAQMATQKVQSGSGKRYVTPDEPQGGAPVFRDVLIRVLAILLGGGLGVALAFIRAML